MTSFFRKILFFSMGCFILIIGCISITEYFTTAEKYYKIANDKNIVILGHSHTECALNDSIINNSINFSQSAESYFYTFLKLKKLHQANPQLNTVLLELTNNNFDITMDEWIFGDKYLAFRYGQYSQLMNFNDKLFLFKNNSNEFLRMQSPALKKKMLFYTNKKSDFFNYFNWGGYTPRPICTINATQTLNTEKSTTILKQSKPVMTEGVSEKNIFYLHKIVEYCIENKLKLIFIRTPLKPDYTKMHEQKLQQLITKDFKDILFLDLADYKLPDEDFNDKEHLSYSGSVRISYIVDSSLHVIYKQNDLPNGNR